MAHPSTVSLIVRRLGIGFFALGIGAWATSRTSSLENVGIRNAVVPGFGPDGVRSWELRASQVVPQDAGVVKARDILLSTFQGAKVETLVQSPTARFRTEKGSAQSQSPIHLKGVGYEIRGVGWEWDANQSRIRIKSKVKAVFDDELTSFLD